MWFRKKKWLLPTVLVVCFLLWQAGAAVQAKTESTAVNLANLEDGNYRIEVKMEGGSGRASITSPAKMQVKNHKATVRMEWSSSNYDYMVVDGTTYKPVTADGNSAFEVPVCEFDKEIKMSADTTAMSVPHEIEYTFTFVSDSIKKEGAKPILAVILISAGVSVVVFAGCGIFLYRRRGIGME